MKRGGCATLAADESWNPAVLPIGRCGNRIMRIAAHAMPAVAPPPRPCTMRGMDDNQRNHDRDAHNQGARDQDVNSRDAGSQDTRNQSAGNQDTHTQAPRTPAETVPPTLAQAHSGRRILRGRIYRHFKGDRYLVEDFATDSESGLPVVVYRKLYADGSLWVRPLEMFAGEVDRAKYPEVRQRYRFELEDVPSVNHR